MRLLNVDSKELHEIPDSTLTKTKYAILSHRWEERGEITFRDLGNLDDPQLRTSYEKIDGCCRQAKADGLAWVWIDTCCINKDSSAELSEAINSMFRWYEDAEVCYVYLSDVPSGEIPWLPDSSFRKSLWFTRGWTLQELLAPRYKVFYDKNWSLIGAVHNSDYEIHCVEQLEVGHHPQKSLQRNSWRYLPNPSMPTVDLTDAIHETTGIDRQVITNNRKLYTVHAAEKMDWASCRKTTRPEDIAYCLLGIFGVNMPPLYGEGGRAFLRLQKEIIHNTYDHSIFSWGLGGYQLDNRDCPHWDFLARHPDAFRGFSRTINTFRTGGALKSESDISVFQTKRHYSLTNLGLQIELPLIPLNCASKEAGEEGKKIQCHSLLDS
ncbi:putative het domain-containing protein [Rosellinia necatrix]|uniref:Putative het domain-containing protein n=1 Tax=Rosellinia necatrix TaxID=77044 RepID=A0A1W2TMB1_ROSNE|nr:putative het domain-containing protein [Rosellinia necatrix]